MLLAGLGSERGPSLSLSVLRLVLLPICAFLPSCYWLATSRTVCVVFICLFFCFFFVILFFLLARNFIFIFFYFLKCLTLSKILDNLKIFSIDKGK